MGSSLIQFTIHIEFETVHMEQTFYQILQKYTCCV